MRVRGSVGPSPNKHVMVMGVETTGFVGHESPNRRTTTNSALRLARRALSGGQSALPGFASHLNRKSPAVLHLFALQVVRKLLRLDYSRAAMLVSEWTDLRRTFGLRKIPIYTTLYCAERQFLDRHLSLITWRSWLYVRKCTQ